MSSLNKFSYIYESTLGLVRKLFFAVDKQDIEGIKYLVGRYKVPDNETLEYNDPLLVFVYTTDFLSAADLLIKFGLEFSPLYLLNTYPSQSNITKYNKHLLNLVPHVNQIDSEESIAIVKTLVSLPVIEYNVGSCYYAPYLTLNSTYTNNYNFSNEIYHFQNDLYNQSHFIIQESFIAVSGFILLQENKSFKIISPKTNHNITNYGYFTHIRGDNEVIYFPFSKTHSYKDGIFVHELTHCAINKLFENDSKPYRANDTQMMLKYHQAAKKVIIDILELFGGNKLFEKIIKMEYSEETTVEELNLRDFLKIVSYTQLSLFMYKSKSQDSNFVKYVYNTFHPHPNPKDDLEKMHPFISLYYSRLIEKYNLTEDHLELLDRISECIFRPIEDFDQELIVRIGELYTKVVNPNLLEVFAPLEEFWKTAISPEIKEMWNDIRPQLCSDVNSTTMHTSGEANNITYEIV